MQLKQQNNGGDKMNEDIELTEEMEKELSNGIGDDENV
jgi:hypothetical protein